MFLTIIIAFASLIILIIIHELGHFITAKKFGVKVEEFGLGYPPRLFGKKIGETLYSINLLPFGGFVKIYGQEEPVDHPRSFSNRPIYQRALIILGGVISFWIVSVILLTVVTALGQPTIVEDSEDHNLVNPKVQILAVDSNSPAERAGLESGDIIKELKFSGQSFKTDKVKQIQEFVQKHKGREIILKIQRGKRVFDVSLTPRLSPPQGEGPIGVSLVRTALKSYPWYQAPVKGITATGELTLTILKGWGMVISSLVRGRGMPPGAELGGPIKIINYSTRAWGLGLNYFLVFIAVISVALAIVNILPIPALDGGWFLFLLLEKLRGKPLNQKIIQNVSTFFFFLLITLLILVTIKDIRDVF